MLTDLDLGGQIVPETGVSFYVNILEVVAIIAQSQTLTQYASWLCWPIYMRCIDSSYPWSITTVTQTDVM